MTQPQAYRGERLGLPETGPASIAPGGSRAMAFIVDALASTLIAALFVLAFRHGHAHGHGLEGRLPGSWSLLPFAVDYILGTLLAGRTLGMYLFDLRLIRVDDQNQPVTPWRIFTRTILLLLLVPALIYDKDGRGLHDRYSETAVVRG